jgi:SAM-dependent methyltransferase
MRLITIAENPIERLLLTAGLVPTPLMDTMVALLLARTIMTATKLHVFDALASGPLSAKEVARYCQTDSRATEKLLFALTGARYLRVKADKYALAPATRKWLLKDSSQSLRDAVLHRYLDADLMEHAEEFLRTGQATNFHDNMSPEQWELYQRGQRAHAVYSAPEVARRVPVPKNPRTMLDIGGAHGHFSAALCRRYPDLHSVILDLPEAAGHSQPLLACEGLKDRLTYRVGNALTDEIGREEFDLIFVANLVHHFDDGQNRALMKKIAHALRPGGSCVILEIIRPESPRRAGQVGALTDFYFAITSSSGTWSFKEMGDWQKQAGLRAYKPIKLRMSPGYGMQAARK